MLYSIAGYIVFGFCVILTIFISIACIKNRKKGFLSIGIGVAILSIVVGIEALLFAAHCTKSQETKDYSPTELLRMADVKYNEEDFEGVFEILTSEQVENEAETYRKLGYMYSQGLYVKRDISKAEQYFEKSVDMGLQAGKFALFALYVENDCSLAADYLLKNQDDSSFIETINKLMDSKLNLSGQTAEEIEALIVETLLVTIEDYTSSTSPMASDFYNRYTETGRETSLDPEKNWITTITYYYKHEQRVLANPDELYYRFE